MKIELSRNPQTLAREVRSIQRKLHRARAGAQVSRYRRAIELRLARLATITQSRKGLST